MDDYDADGTDMGDDAQESSGVKGGMAAFSQMQSYLEGVDYPAEKEDLISRARENGAPDDVVSTLNKLPDTTYDSPMNVTEELGKME